MRVTFVRHGASTATGGSTLVGQTDHPLSSLGRLQASAVAERLADRQLDALWSSPLQRALHTATAIGGTTGQLPITDARLAEINLGRYDGLSFADMTGPAQVFREKWQRRPGTTRWPGGETLTEVAARNWQVLEALYDRHPKGHVVVVSHMFAISAVLTRVFRLKVGQFRTFAVDVASLTTIQMDKSGFRLLLLNDTAHLQHLPPASPWVVQALPPLADPMKASR